MTGVGRLRVVAVSVVLLAAMLLLAGPRAWAAVHQTATRCARPAPSAVTTHVINSTRNVAAGGSWRVHTLGNAGCGAWRHMHARMHHHHHKHR
jgi:hypothetical protein